MNAAMHKKTVNLSIATFLLLIMAQVAAEPSPMEVAEEFWRGVKERDIAAVSRNITSESLEFLKQHDPENYVLPIKQVTLGRTVIDGDLSWIDTEVVIEDERPMVLSLQTVLQQENGQWKVDYNSTVATISSNSAVARMLGDLSVLSRQFADELNESLEQAQKALPEIERELGRLESELKQALPEIRQRVEELVRKLEEALGKKRDDEPTSPRTREI